MTTNDDYRTQLEDEIADLDLPAVNIAVILLTLGDAFDIDPWAITYAWGKAPNAPYTIEITREARAMLDMIDEAIESSTQIPHINAAMDLYRSLDEIDD